MGTSHEWEQAAGLARLGVRAPEPPMASRTHCGSVTTARGGRVGNGKVARRSMVVHPSDVIQVKAAFQ